MRVPVGFLSHQRIRLSSSLYAVDAAKTRSCSFDQVKAWQQAVDPAIDELRQIGPLLPQLMAQICGSARQIHEFTSHRNENFWA
jgi:hypothetical protein